MISLVGYTGFVGSNIYASGKIDNAYNSVNINEAYGTCPDLLIYSGMRAEKFIANKNPELDMELVYQAEDNIKKILPKKLVLISTIDVFDDPCKKTEESEVTCSPKNAYGYNRLMLEKWVRENYHDALIIRLPALYGENLKKNFIYDMINVIPFKLSNEKFDELSAVRNILEEYYECQGNGFYQLKLLDDISREGLKKIFLDLGFTAMNFTDSRNVYQFYPLSHLMNDIQIALSYGIKILHLSTQPVSAGELYEYITGRKFENHVLDHPVYYDYRTVYSEKFGGYGGYIMDKKQVMNDILHYLGGRAK